MRMFHAGGLRLICDALTDRATLTRRESRRAYNAFGARLIGRTSSHDTGLTNPTRSCFPPFIDRLGTSSWIRAGVPGLVCQR